MNLARQLASKRMKQVLGGQAPGGRFTPHKQAWPGACTIPDAIINELDADLTATKRAHEEEVADLKLVHGQEVCELKHVHEEEVRELRRVHEEAIGELKRVHEVVGELKRVHEEEVRALKELFDVS